MLVVSALEAGYGHIRALRGVDITVAQGEFVAILGPNGAGKSTLLKAIIGVLRQAQGSIHFEGNSLDGMATARRIRAGIGIIPEGRQLFPDMTVRENLVLGAYATLGLRIPAALEGNLETVFSLFPRLGERRAQLAGSLSGGEAQMVAVGRALMGKPRLLLCDEPSLGLAPQLVRELLATFRRLQESGITILLADQNANAVLRIADRAYILDTGQVAAAGLRAELEADPRLRAAYLGSGVTASP